MVLSTVFFSFFFKGKPDVFLGGFSFAAYVFFDLVMNFWVSKFGTSLHPTSVLVYALNISH